MRNRVLNYGKIYSKYPNDPAVRGHYYKLFREYSKLRKYKQRQYKQDLLAKIESLHNDNPKMYWKLIEELKDSKTTDSSSNVSPSQWVSHFKNLSQPKPEFQQRTQQLEEKLKNLENLTNKTELDNPITEQEISSAIRTLKQGKSPGLDHISNNMLKCGQLVLLPCIHKLFNNCLTHGIYPKTWTSGYITPIHKNGDTSDPNNYRGITVTNALGKLFNKILDIRLEKFLNKHRIINDCQIGFTRKARTSDHMFILKTLIDKYCKGEGRKIYACFVDFQKAFDTVIHTGIKLKLLQIGICSNFYEIIKNMYLSSKSCIRINNRITNFFPLGLGVKQGDNLSPNLFKVFINDLPTYLNSTPDPVFINNSPLHCLMYADDVILLSSTHAGLQQKLDKLHDYCKDWCLNINTNKTKIIIFNKAGRHLSEKFVFGQTDINCIHQYKYLGVKFSSSGSFSFAQEDLYNRALKAYYKLQKDFLSFSPNIKNCLHVFDHTIKPILLYGSEIWGAFNPFSPKLRNLDSNIDFDQIMARLPSEKLHIKFCKSILGVHKKSTNFACLSELGRFPLHFDITKSMSKYWYRLENLGNSFPLLREAYLESKRLHESKVPSWYGCMSVIIQKVPGIKDLAHVKQFKFKHSLKRIFRSHYEDIWHSQLPKQSTGKLSSYVKFKSNFGLEKYLLKLNFNSRRSLTKLRISSHRLGIERGRYTNIPRHDRICSRCNINELDDEIHFLFKCSLFNTDRDQLHTCIATSCPNFTNLNLENKFIWLMTTENTDVLQCLCNFILKSNI